MKGMPKFKNISGVILAGGSSKRLNGIIKAKIIIDGRTIISRIIDTMNELFVEIIIITNTPDEFEEYNSYKIIGDEFHNKGPLGGIHSAMKISSSEALFIVAGDMPLLDKNYIIRQVKYFNDNNYDVVIPGINHYNEPLHGVYKKSLLGNLEEYLKVERDNSVSAFLNRSNTGYLQFEDSEKTRKAFFNINSPGDITVLKKLLYPAR